MKIKDIPISERPREKLLKYSASNLSDAELIATIIKTGTKDQNAVDISYELLKKIKNISNLKKCTLNDLTTIKGIGKAKAIEILAVIEISKRIYHNVNKDLIKYDILKHTNTLLVMMHLCKLQYKFCSWHND